MASIFYEKLSHLNQESQKVLNCFLNELKHAVKNKFGESHWTEEKPNEIIDIANDICHDHEKNKKMFPIERKTLISLMFTLFRWMYKNKWTDHKLLKKNS
jgi:glutamine synthetase adenylyltransferase